MTNEEYVSLRCLEISQPIGTFYVGCIDHKDLADISYADVLRIEQDRDVERYLGVERPLSPQRVQQISKYVETVDATFPTSVILAISSEDAEYDEQTETMTVKGSPEVAKIIDGQHRIAGLRDFSGKEFQLSVTVFIDMELEDQAMVFATINLEQTKVSKSIAYALYEYATARSPQKTCHNIAKFLNNRQGSPFHDKIKILGTATEGKTGETLTQATFVERLLPLLSKDALIDRDRLKRGKKLDRVDLGEEPELIFGNMFIDEEDAAIARVIWNYFTAVEQTWPDAWSVKQPGNILNRTTGFGALMRFLPSAYMSLPRKRGIIDVQDFESVFKRIALVDEDFNSETFIPGTSGETALFRTLSEQTGL